MKTIKHRISGTATGAGSSRSVPVYGPAAGRRQAEVRPASRSEVDTAVAAAGKTFETRANSSLSPCSRILFASSWKGLSS